MFNLLLRHRTKKFIKENVREKVFLNWNEIKNILVLFDTEDYENVDMFIKYLKEKNNKNVKVLAFKNKNDNRDYTYIPYTIMTGKNVKDWTGNSINSLIEPLLESNFDLVIDLTLKAHPPLEYVLARVNASLKAGYKKTELPLYDLTITQISGLEDPDLEPVKELADQIVHYLSIIESNNRE